MGEQNNDLLFAVKEVITHARLQVYRVANSALLESYWKIGKLIVEDEQHGNNKARYGENTLKTLSPAA